MSWDTVRPQIAVILADVEGPGGLDGVIHQYQRLSVQSDKFLEHFAVTESPGKKRINGGIITRSKLEEPVSSSSHNELMHGVIIRWYYGVNDAEATELLFQAFIERICAAFRAKYQINGTCSDSTPVQAPIIEPRMFSSVLCHFCELTFTVTEWNAWS